MFHILPFLFGVILGLIIIMSISLMFTVFAVGWFIPKNKLDKYMEKYEKDYFEMDNRNSMFYGPISLPFIARGCSSVLNRWYISRLGIIPRWSKWSKFLDEKREKWIQHSGGPGIDKYL